MYHIRPLTGSGTSSSRWKNMSIAVVCKSMWQNMRAYQTITNNPCPYIIVELLLVFIQHSFSHKSQFKCFRTHLDRTLFLVFVRGTRAQSLSVPFSYAIYIYIGLHTGGCHSRSRFFVSRAVENV
jgi:hypothetical protein